MATEIYANNGSGNGLFAWGHQTIIWNNIDFSLAKFRAIHQRAISQQVPKLLFCIMSLKFILLKITDWQHVQGVKELKIWRSWLTHSPKYLGKDSPAHHTDSYRRERTVYHNRNQSTYNTMIDTWCFSSMKNSHLFNTFTHIKTIWKCSPHFRQRHKMNTCW